MFTAAVVVCQHIVQAESLLPYYRIPTERAVIQQSEVEKGVRCDQPVKNHIHINITARPYKLLYGKMFHLNDCVALDNLLSLHDSSFTNIIRYSCRRKLSEFQLV